MTQWKGGSFIAIVSTNMGWSSLECKGHFIKGIVHHDMAANYVNTEKKIIDA